MPVAGSARGCPSHETLADSATLTRSSPGVPAAAGMYEGSSQVFSEEFSRVPRTSAQVAQQASAPGITGVGVSAMDNSVTIIATVGGSIVHGRCPLLLPDDQLIEKRRHHNHGRIPEWPVHARRLAFAVRSRLSTVSRGAGTRGRAQLSVKRQNGLAASRWSWANVAPQIWTVSPDALRPAGLRRRELARHPRPTAVSAPKPWVTRPIRVMTRRMDRGPRTRFQSREKMLRVRDG